MNNRGADDLRRHRTHYDVIVMNPDNQIPINYNNSLCTTFDIQTSHCCIRQQFQQIFLCQFHFHLMLVNRPFFLELKTIMNAEQTVLIMKRITLSFA